MLERFLGRFRALAAISAAMLVLLPLLAHAEGGKRRLRLTKKLSISEQQSSRNTSPSDQSFSLLDAGFDSFDGTLYDSHSLSQLRDLKDRAQPWWDPEYQDEDGLKVAVSKALLIQSSRTVLPMIRRSDIGPEYRAMEDNIQEFFDALRYSVQDNGDSYTLARSGRGKKLLEMTLKLSPSTGLDPQLWLSDEVRVRYNWSENQSLLEYVTGF